MTIIYQYRVATTSLGGFLKLLRAWKGSVYKLLYKELIIFISVYAAISLVYRFGLTEDQKLFFEAVVLGLFDATSAIPLSFLLGFYVTFIVQRWWKQFNNVPWPDRTLFLMSAYLHGFDDRARMMRRSVARYMMFGLIWICRAISLSVMKRFPTLDHIVDAGFITKEEKVMFENTECIYQKFFVPLMWANQILVTARRENKIETDYGLRMIIESLADFRDKCSLCFVYDWITVPLVYTQVVTFAVYSYFAVSLFGQQYLDPAKHYKGFELDFYIPGFTILQFLFYMGWLKVAEQMINPFGEDDDDFDINWLLDRHTAVAFALVDQCYGKYPSLVRDGFWNDIAPDVPYTESSARFMRPNFLGSTFNIEPPTQRNDNLFIPQHDDINQHDWLQRNRRKGSLTGSLLSLYPFKSTRTQGGSMTTLGSVGSGQGRYMPNGKVYYYVLGKDQDTGGSRSRWSSVEIPVRERANTDSDFRDVNSKQRKLSLPFITNPFSRSKQKKAEPAPASGSPKVTRFNLEPIKDISVTEAETSSPTKARRSGHVSIPFQSLMSRIPMLSVISESNTLTSLSQNSASWENDSNDVFEEAALNGILPEDDAANENEISRVGETISGTTNDESIQPTSNINNAAAVKSSPLKTPSAVSTTHTEAATVVVQPSLASARKRKISMPSFLSKLQTTSAASVDKSVAMKSALKNSLSASPSKVTMKTTTSNIPLLSAFKKGTDEKDFQQSNHHSVKNQSNGKILAPLIAFDDYSDVC
ncbi:hypothetical protein BsWGS_16696 [Bradybaena similaris]